MTASFMGVNIDPTTVKDGSLKDAFDPITHPQTTGFGATVLTGIAKVGGSPGPIINSVVKATTTGTLAPGTYVYTISSVGPFGEGKRGPANTVVIAAALTAPVQGAATVTPTDSGIWDDGAWTYLAAPVQDAATITPTDGGTWAGTGTYYYVVTATNALGETTASNEISGVVAADTDSVTVNWEAVTDATGYNIYRGTTAATEDHLVGTVGIVTSFVDTGDVGTVAAVPTTNTTAVGTYYYVVTATNAIGETTGSNEHSAVVAAVTSSVTVNWAAVTGATGYKIYRGTSAATEDHLVGTVGSGGALSYKDHGATGTSASVPGSNTSSTTTNKTTLGWVASAGEVGGYKVYRGALHLADVAHGAPLSYIDTGSVSPSGAAPTTFSREVDTGIGQGEDAPKPTDAGSTPVEGEGDFDSPTEAAL